jgi:carbon monoxide dehydrogenase subunit G
MATLKIEERFTVRAPDERVWRFLLDPRRVAPCLPGASLERVEGDDTFFGGIKVKVGPVQTQFKGKARLTDVDAAARAVTIVGEGRDQAGAGAAKMTMHSKVRAIAGGETEVTVSADVELAGKLVTFGRGLVQGISAQLFKQFTERARKALEAEGGASDPPAPVVAPPAAAEAPAEEAPPPRAEQASADVGAWTVGTTPAPSSDVAAAGAADEPAAPAGARGAEAEAPAGAGEAPAAAALDLDAPLGASLGAAALLDLDQPIGAAAALLDLDQPIGAAGPPAPAENAAVAAPDALPADAPPAAIDPDATPAAVSVNVLASAAVERAAETSPAAVRSASASAPPPAPAPAPIVAAEEPEALNALALVWQALRAWLAGLVRSLLRKG